MSFHRISVKYPIAEAGALDLDKVILVFHQWIQQSAVPGRLMDVADYRHMTDGPSVLLVGHDRDYGIDLSDGKMSVFHTLKRDVLDSVGDALAVVFPGALTAMKRLEKDESVKLRGLKEQATLLIQDRLRAENSAKGLDIVRADVERVVKAIYGGAAATISRDDGDARRCLTVSIAVKDALDAAALAKNAEALVPVKT